MAVVIEIVVLSAKKLQERLLIFRVLTFWKHAVRQTRKYGPKMDMNVTKDNLKIAARHVPIRTGIVQKGNSYYPNERF